MQPAQARVSIHDGFQLELKLDYPFDPAEKRGHQGVEAWLYFPSNLGIDEPAFDRESWYADLAAYIRFQTPRMSLERLFMENSASSPFNWLATHGRQLVSGAATGEDYAMALRELRLFAAVFRALVRDESQFVADQLRRAAGARPPLVGVLADLAEATTRFLAGSRDALRRFRGLRRLLLDARTPEGLREALGAIDDFLSLQALERWFTLLDAVDRAAGCCPPLDAAAVQLREAIVEERLYRESAGLVVGADDANPAQNERFVQRHNQLKKYVLAVLHLRLVSSRRRERIQDAAFGIAAAASMTVAVVLQLVALWTVGTPTGPQAGASLFAFMALAVGSYILKDRMKDRMKGWFQARMPRWLFDRRQNLAVEAGGDHIGAIEETVHLLRAGDVPADVRRIREHDEEELFASQRAEEDVVHYRRSLVINGPRARKLGPEMGAINEILRINVRRWLRRMDEPVRELWRLDPDGTVRHVKAPKTYRVNLVLGLRSDSGHVRYERRVIVLSREGILRVEAAGVF